MKERIFESKFKKYIHIQMLLGPLFLKYITLKVSDKKLINQDIKIMIFDI